MGQPRSFDEFEFILKSQNDFRLGYLGRSESVLLLTKTIKKLFGHLNEAEIR